MAVRGADQRTLFTLREHHERRCHSNCWASGSSYYVSRLINLGHSGVSSRTDRDGQHVPFVDGRIRVEGLCRLAFQARSNFIRRSVLQLRFMILKDWLLPAVTR